MVYLGLWTLSVSIPTVNVVVELIAKENVQCKGIKEIGKNDKKNTPIIVSILSVERKETEQKKLAYVDAKKTVDDVHCNVGANRPTDGRRSTLEALAQCRVKFTVGWPGPARRQTFSRDRMKSENKTQSVSRV